MHVRHTPSVQSHRHVRVVAAVTILALATLLPACATVDNLMRSVEAPTAKITGTRLEQLTLDGATLGLDVAVRNGAAVPLPLVDLAYGLESRGGTIATGRAALSGTIDPGATRTLAIPVELRFRDVLAALDGIEPGSIVPYTATATLSTNAPALGRLDLPLQRSGELPIPAVPTVRLEQVRWDRLTLEEATAVVALNVTNTNAFGVDLANLEYELSLAGTRVAQSSLAGNTELPSGVARTVEIPIRVRPLDLGMGLYNALTGSRADYQVHGAMAVISPYGPVRLPFEHAGQTPLIR